MRNAVVGIGMLLLAVAIIVVVNVPLPQMSAPESSASELFAAAERVVAKELLDPKSAIGDSYKLGQVLDSVVKRTNDFAPLDESLREESKRVGKAIADAGLGGDVAVTLTDDLRKKVASILEESASRIE